MREYEALKLKYVEQVLGKAMSMVHKKGITVDDKTLDTIWDQFDVDTVCVPRCLAPAGQPARVCVHLFAYHWAAVPSV